MTRARSQADRLLAAATLLAGLLTLIAGWLGVSGTPYPAEQLPYLISGGIGALFLLGVSATLWLSADLRDEWRKLDRIERAIRETTWDDGEHAAEPYATVDVSAGAVPDTADAEAPTERLDRQNGGKAPSRVSAGDQP
ncbi:hypothetical protein [Haloechinothrix salitolerans]|uniref:Uncharacterized protein n=1 Tax=Haloechinothrix salitolerans TaxID=926830 RepID=A0ABW2BVJ3_9PSEU